MGFRDHGVMRLNLSGLGFDPLSKLRLRLSAGKADSAKCFLTLSYDTESVCKKRGQ